MLGKRDFLFDKRLADRFISRGQLSWDEYQAHLAGLPDVGEKSEPMCPPGEEGNTERADTEQDS